MDEMTRLAWFRSEVRRPDLADLRAEEERLLGAIAAPASTRPRRAGRLRFGLAAGLVAAAVTAGAVVAGLPGGPRTDPVVPARPVAAVEVLNRAAQNAGATPELHPRPGQYLVYESQTMATAESFHGAHHRSRYLTRSRETVWYPVAGDATGAVMETTNLPPRAYPGWPIPPEAWETVGHSGPARFAAGDTRPLRTDYAHTSRLPSTAAGMHEYLYLDLHDGLADLHAWDRVGELLQAYLPAAQRAALFRAASAIHGVTTIGQATDAAGRTGIGVTLVIPGLGVREEYILDRTTYQYLGERSVVTDAARAKAPAGSMLMSSALLKVSVADHPPTVKDH